MTELMPGKAQTLFTSQLGIRKSWGKRQMIENVCMAFKEWQRGKGSKILEFRFSAMNAVKPEMFLYEVDLQLSVSSRPLGGLAGSERCRKYLCLIFVFISVIFEIMLFWILKWIIYFIHLSKVRIISEYLLDMNPDCCSKAWQTLNLHCSVLGSSGRSSCAGRF